MSRRDLVLEEMGLGPRWRLRAAPDADARRPAVTSGEAVVDTPIRGEGQRPEGGSAAKAATQDAAASGRDPVHVADRTCVAKAAAALHAPSPSSPAPPAMSSARRDAILTMDWPALRAAVAHCVACPLHAKRNQTVFGVGGERASWLFVGEGPGAEEDATGEPFVGQAGRLLDNMLAAIGMQRGEDVYIANVVKCRPPNNRNPESGEMNCCEPYLARQIELIRPKLIVAMGKIAASHLLRTDAAVASLRGRVHDYRGTPLIVTYHPAYLLRTLPDKAKAWTDLCFAQDRMAAIVAAGQSAPG